MNPLILAKERRLLGKLLLRFGSAKKIDVYFNSKP
jgi:hypothetical protein